MEPIGEPPFDRGKAEAEARAKVIWGDDPVEVVGFLTANGYSCQEASGLVDALRQDRAATVRGLGIRKIVIGSGMLAVLAVAIVFMFSVRHVIVELVAIPGAMGVFGLWKVVEGAQMLLLPQKHEGDLADETD